MAWLDDIGLGQLADAISSFFARKTEAGGSLGWDGSTITLYSVTGGVLDSENLDSGLATDAQAGNSIGLSGSSLVLYNVNGGQLSSVGLSNLINSAVSSGTSGLISASTANDRFASSLSLSGKTLRLISYDGTILDSVTLP